MKELSKFGFHSDSAIASDQDLLIKKSEFLSIVQSDLPKSLRVGEMCCSFLEANYEDHSNSLISKRYFLGSNFRSTQFWVSRINSDPNFSRFKLEEVRDLRQAGYSDFEIQQSIGLWGLPSPTLLNNILKCDWPTSAKVYCDNCLGLGHLKRDCTSLVRCRCCKQLGHFGHFCPLRCRACRVKDHTGAVCPFRKLWRIKSGQRDVSTSGVKPRGQNHGAINLEN
jgi:hypothetical protein